MNQQKENLRTIKGLYLLFQTFYSLTAKICIIWTFIWLFIRGVTLFFKIIIPQPYLIICQFLACLTVTYATYECFSVYFKLKREVEQRKIEREKKRIIK